MLVELKKLTILNEGYQRKISLNKMYVNSSHVVSITDYNGAKEFLISEGSQNYANRNFSLLKISNHGTLEEVIVLGSSEELFNKFNSSDKRKLLSE
jgi:ferritin